MRRLIAPFPCSNPAPDPFSHKIKIETLQEFKIKTEQCQMASAGMAVCLWRDNIHVLGQRLLVRLSLYLTFLL